MKALLGLHATLPRSAVEPREIARKIEGGIVVERVAYPSEGGIRVPAIVLRRENAEGRLPIVMIFDDGGKESLLMANGPDSPRRLANDGNLVVLPDVRCFGEMLSTGGKDDRLQWRAWERNGIVWGRPVPGMGCTDILGVLDGLSRRPDADMARIELIARNSGDLAITAMFAAAHDARVASVDVDMNRCCFELRNLALVPRVLQHGDVLQWSALLANRRLTIRNVPPQAGDPAWLNSAFALAGNRDGLRIDPK